MKKVIEEAIKKLTKKAHEEVDPSDAMKFSQTALNLAHAYATFKEAEIKGR